MDALSITQTIFYAVASIVLVILGGLLVAAALRLLGILNEVKSVADGFKFIYDSIKNAAGKIVRPIRHRKE